MWISVQVTNTSENNINHLKYKRHLFRQLLQLLGLERTALEITQTEVLG